MRDSMPNQKKVAGMIRLSDLFNVIADVVLGD